MFEKLESVEKRYIELTQKISDPDIISNNNEWKKLVKEHSSIEDVVLKFREYKKTDSFKRMCALQRSGFFTAPGIAGNADL